MQKIVFQSTNGFNPKQNATVSRFLFACAPTFLLQGLATDVSGMAGLGRTKIALPSQFASAFSFRRKFAVCLSSSNGVAFFGDGPYVLLPTVDASHHHSQTQGTAPYHHSHSPSSLLQIYILQTVFWFCSTSPMVGTAAPKRVATTFSLRKHTSNGATEATLVMFLAAEAFTKASITALKMSCVVWFEALSYSFINEKTKKEKCYIVSLHFLLLLSNKYL